MDESADNRLFVLGTFRLEHHGQELHVARRKVASLLAYLALYPQRHSRNELAGLLWGDYPDREARMSLRTSLALLRSLLGEDVVIADAQAVQINPTFPLWVDALAFESYARQFLAEPPFDLSAAFIEYYQGDLLPDVDDDWVTPARERLHSLYIETLLHAVQVMRSHSDYRRAIALAQRVLACEPANERAHQHLMFCYMTLADRSAALQQYDACVKALRHELAVEPMPETTALYNWIKGSPAPAEAGAAHVTNLPIPLTSFVGREREMTEVKRLLAQHRLVTLTGPGGSGKTRLAIHVATDLVDAYADGVWFSDLAGLESGSAVAGCVAQAAGAPPAESGDTASVLAAHLRYRHALLVFDNCERVVEACAALAQTILSTCPRISILATSREVLGVACERIAPVPPLSVPDIAECTLLADLAPFESARLLIERATALPGVALAESDAPAVASVCRQLDGMPLAIELAAARLRALPASVLASHLHERFALLASGSRGGPPRQHSLRAAIDWSYDSLSPDEQTMLRRLSVFAGSFEQSGAPAVYGAGVSETQALDLLARLVDKSLVNAERVEGQLRYRMLDTIRLYAWEKLVQAGEKDATIVRYLAFYIEWLEHLGRSVRAVRHYYALGRTRASPERDNVTHAIDWCKEQGHIEIGIRLINGLWPQLMLWGAARSFTPWIQIVLSHVDELPVDARIGGLMLAAKLERQNGDWDRVEQIAERAAILARSLGMEGWSIQVLAWRVKFALMRGAEEVAVQRYDELVQTAGEALPRQTYWVYLDAAHALTRLGRLDEALELWELGLQGGRETGHESMLAYGAAGPGLVALKKGDGAKAEACFRDSLTIATSYGHRRDQTLAIEWLAQAVAMQGRLEGAATLWGAAEGAHRTGVQYTPAFVTDCVASTTELRRRMGDSAFAAAYEGGLAMTMEQSVAYALSTDAA